MTARPSRGAGAKPGGSAQRILGVDPGTVVTGWGVVEMLGSSLRHLAHGTIGSSANLGQGGRLRRIYRGLQEVIEQYKPERVSLEKVFFARNAQSALKLGQARGVALLAAAENGVSVYEYTSAEIKQAVVGYGQASKEQVAMMIGSLLHLSGKIPADAADALAAAICCLHERAFQTRVMAARAVYASAESPGKTRGLKAARE
ncbi:MAG: crossover junction endodeoxyribonuclease RuvC [Deltaproteobacteria bacterium]|nr:MAG: crossover junction endodeoxyribonuclease RuvC [Deltaproteobacteria bacterium]